MVFSLAWCQSSSLAERVKSGMVAMVFHKSYQLKNLEDTGMVTNLICNDSDRIFEVANFLSFTIIGPIHIAVTIVLVCVLLGWPAVPGTMLIPLGFLGSRLMGNRLGALRARTLPLSDKRLSQIAELLSSIATVKLYNYEAVFSERIDRLRGAEVALLRWMGIIVAGMSTNVQAILQIPTMMSILLFIYYSGVPLTPPLAFTTLSLLNGIWFSTHMTSLGLSRIGQSRPCFERLSRFMALPELPRGRAEWAYELQPGHNASVTLTRASFRYPVAGASAPAAAKTAVDVDASEAFTLQDISMHAEAGKLLMVAGPVGR